MANFVKGYALDGIDIDYKDFPAVLSFKAEAWLEGKYSGMLGGPS